MQNLIVAALVSATLFQGAPPHSSSVRRSEALLVRFVIDGDTIDVATVGRVRLLGIDAPEMARQSESAAPFARDAHERLSSLLLHRWIRLEFDGPTRDIYDRHLAYVLTEDGQFVNALMVREGLARVSVRGPLARLDELQRAEREAQSARRGMWGTAPRVGSATDTRRRSRKNR